MLIRKAAPDAALIYQIELHGIKV